jgi:hypothetical protein
MEYLMLIKSLNFLNKSYNSLLRKQNSNLTGFYVNLHYFTQFQIENSPKETLDKYLVL